MSHVSGGRAAHERNEIKERNMTSGCRRAIGRCQVVAGSSLGAALACRRVVARSSQSRRRVLASSQGRRRVPVFVRRRVAADAGSPPSRPTPRPHQVLQEPQRHLHCHRVVTAPSCARRDTPGARASAAAPRSGPIEGCSSGNVHGRAHLHDLVKAGDPGSAAGSDPWDEPFEA